MNKIETVGNKLPAPLTIFFCLAVAVVIISGIGAALGWSATGQMYNSSTGVSNFTGYAPLGVTIVIMLGIGVAESSGFSTSAAQTLDPSYNVNALSNWYFMIVSTFLITLIGTLITEKVILPRLGEYKENGDGTLRALTPTRWC